MGKSKNKKKNDNALSKNQWLIIVLVVFLIIVTLGFIFWQTEKEKKQKFNNELENKQNRLKFVNNKIVELEKKKETLAQMEKTALIGGRALVGFFIVMLNCLYNYYYLFPFDFTRLLDFNGAILLCYSFIAFITYGTPTNFATNIKKRFSDYLKSNHIDSLAELEQLIIEKKALEKEISEIENTVNRTV